jgi:hypothetical protein
LRTVAATGIAAASSGLIVAGLIGAAQLPDRGVQVSEFLGAVAFTVVGTVLTTRRSENTLSWLFATIGLCMAYLAASNHAPTDLPGAAYVGWLGWWAFLLSGGLLATFVLLLFPDGSLPSHRWRFVGWAAAAGLLLLGLSEALMPVDFTGTDAALGNPFAVPSLKGLLDAGFLLGALLFFLAVIASVAAVVVRYRRADDLQRHQIKWVLFAAAWGVSLWVAGNAVQSVTAVSWDVIMAGVILPLPVAVLVAVLRYRLYDIDRIISRSLGYAALTVLCVGIYLAAVSTLTALTAPVTRESPVAVAAATLLAAAAFQPARRRIQAGVDRRFNRARYDSHQTVQGFAATMRTEVDLDQLQTELAAVTERTLQPTGTMLWLRSEGRS